LIAEDLGTLLQWHWKYATSTFANERQRMQMGLIILFSAFTGSRPATLLATVNINIGRSGIYAHPDTGKFISHPPPVFIGAEETAYTGQRGKGRGNVFTPLIWKCSGSSQSGSAQSESEGKPKRPQLSELHFDLAF
jgi:hypothetical protein